MGKRQTESQSRIHADLVLTDCKSTTVSVGFSGRDCRTRCATANRVRRTTTVVYGTTSATGRQRSASTAGTAAPARRSASAASSTRTASASGVSRQSTVSCSSSAASASTRFKVRNIQKRYESFFMQCGRCFGRWSRSRIVYKLIITSVRLGVSRGYFNVSVCNMVIL